MKKIKLSFAAVLLLAAVACKKSNNTTPATGGNVSNQEAADMVAGSISLNSNGVANVAADASLNASVFVSTHATCGTTKSDSISRQSNPSAPFSYSYKLKYNFTVDCDGSQPDSLSSNLSYSGSFSGPNMSSSNSGTSNFTVNGLLPGASNFVINGEYKRAGSFNSKIDTSNHGNSNVDIMIKSLTLAKPSRNIVSGTATISISGDVARKGSFSYNGTLVFNNNGTATLTLNGTVYIINLASGDRTRV